MHLIDASTAGLPQLTNTWFLALIKGLYHKVAGKKSLEDFPESPVVASDSKRQTSAPDNDSDDGSSTTGSEAPNGATRNGEAKGTARLGPTTKAGGMRRKNVRRK